MPSHLPRELLDHAPKKEDITVLSKRAPLDQAEKQAIITALQNHQGNRQQTADFLGINKTTLWRKMKKFGIDYSTITNDQLSTGPKRVS